MSLSRGQRSALLDLIEKGQADAAIQQCIEWVHDETASKLLELGGYGTLQLNPPGVIPRMRFVAPEEVVPVNVAKIGGVMVVRDDNTGGEVAGTAFDDYWDRFVKTRMAGFQERELATACGIAKAAYAAATNRAADIALNPVGDRPLSVQIRSTAV